VGGAHGKPDADCPMQTPPVDGGGGTTATQQATEGAAQTSQIEAILTKLIEVLTELVAALKGSGGPIQNGENLPPGLNASVGGVNVHLTTPGMSNPTTDAVLGDIRTMAAANKQVIFQQIAAILPAGSLGANPSEQQMLQALDAAAASGKVDPGQAAAIRIRVKSHDEIQAFANYVDAHRSGLDDKTAAGQQSLQQIMQMVMNAAQTGGQIDPAVLVKIKYDIVSRQRGTAQDPALVARIHALGERNMQINQQMMQIMQNAAASGGQIDAAAMKRIEDELVAPYQAEVASINAAIGA
jgi:hypothetical protein